MIYRRNEPVQKRFAVIVDASTRPCSIVLYGKSAVRVGEGPVTVLLLKGALFGDFGGRSLSASMGEEASVALDPYVPKARELLKW